MLWALSVKTVNLNYYLVTLTFLPADEGQEPDEGQLSLDVGDSVFKFKL